MNYFRTRYVACLFLIAASAFPQAPKATAAQPSCASLQSRISGDQQKVVQLTASKQKPDSEARRLRLDSAQNERQADSMDATAKSMAAKKPDMAKQTQKDAADLRAKAAKADAEAAKLEASATRLQKQIAQLTADQSAAQKSFNKSCVKPAPKSTPKKSTPKKKQ